MGTRDQDYSLWTSMKSRCSNSNDKDFARYGGRGITVCKRWQDSFEDFIKDMGPRPDGYTLERLDNDKGYGPDNCKWVDRATQAQNRSTSKHAADNSHEFDAEVFAVGTWNGDKYTKADLDDMVRNFEAGLLRPPVKLGHNEKQPLTDGKPALGWVTKLRRVGEKLIATLSDVPEILVKAIKAGLYKRVSSEIFWNFKQGDSIYKRVLSAVSLLGADIPAVNNLADLTAYLTQSTGEPGSFEKVAQFEISEPHKTNLINQNNDGGNNMAENEFEKKYNDERLAKLAAEQAVKDAEAKVIAAEARVKKYEDDQAEKAKSESEKGLREFCEAQVKAFKMTPSGRDIIVKGLDEGKHAYTQATGFAIPFEVFKEYSETFKDVIDPTEKGQDKPDGKTFDNVQTEADVKIKEYQEAHKDVSYMDAMQKVFAADPDLAKRYGENTNRG